MWTRDLSLWDHAWLTQSFIESSDGWKQQSFLPLFFAPCTWGTSRVFGFQLVVGVRTFLFNGSKFPVMMQGDFDETQYISLHLPPKVCGSCWSRAKAALLRFLLCCGKEPLVLGIDHLFSGQHGWTGRRWDLCSWLHSVPLSCRIQWQWKKLGEQLLHFKFLSTTQSHMVLIIFAFLTHASGVRVLSFSRSDAPTARKSSCPGCARGNWELFIWEGKPFLFSMSMVACKTLVQKASAYVRNKDHWLWVSWLCPSIRKILTRGGLLCDEQRLWIISVWRCMILRSVGSPHLAIVHWIFKKSSSFRFPPQEIYNATYFKQVFDEVFFNGTGNGNVINPALVRGSPYAGPKSELMVCLFLNEVCTALMSTVPCTFLVSCTRWRDFSGSHSSAPFTCETASNRIGASVSQTGPQCTVAAWCWRQYHRVRPQ